LAPKARLGGEDGARVGESDERDLDRECENPYGSGEGDFPWYEYECGTRSGPVEDTFEPVFHS
jgi:hypothetical protein